MNSKVIKLADLDQFQMNEEYKNITVTDDEVETILENMAYTLGKTVEVNKIEENCGIVCLSEEGQKVMIYPSLPIEGAIQASQDVMDKSVGDTFTTVIRDKKMTLTIQEIMVNRPLPLDDSLAKANQIEGVDTLEQLRAYLMDQELEKKREEMIRLLFSDYMQYYLDESEVELDEKEVSDWAIPEAKRVYEEELSFGIDLRFTEEGDMLSLEETLDHLAQELHMQFKMNLIQERFGKENDFVPSEDEESSYDSFMFELLTAKAREALS